MNNKVLSENEPSLVLYHILNDDACAEVRKFIVQNNLIDRVLFRNIDRSETAGNDLIKLQGTLKVPFLVDQNLYLSGSEEIIKYLKTKL